MEYHMDHMSFKDRLLPLIRCIVNGPLISLLILSLTNAEPPSGLVETLFLVIDSGSLSSFDSVGVFNCSS